MNDNGSSQSHFRSPQAIGRVVDNLAKGWGRGQMRQEAEIRAIWAAALGPERLASAQVEGFRGSVLTVRVANETMLKEIRLLSEHLISACNQHITGAKLKRMDVRVGELVPGESYRRPTGRVMKKGIVPSSTVESIQKATSVIEDEGLRESVEGWLHVQAQRNCGENESE